MVQILDRPPRNPSTGERFAEAFGNMGQQIPGLAGQYAENEAIKHLIGQDLSGLSPDLKREFIKTHVTGKAQKQLEKENALQLGLGTINKMRELMSSVGGWTSSPLTKLKSLVPGETQKQRAELESLGRSLIPLVAAGVPVRNQREFDEYRKIITDPSSSPSQLEGALNGLEDLFGRSLEQSGGTESFQESEKPVFDISNPSHKKTGDALMKKFKNDRKKVIQELSKHFREE